MKRVEHHPLPEGELVESVAMVIASRRTPAKATVLATLNAAYLLVPAIAERIKAGARFDEHGDEILDESAAGTHPPGMREA